jgi:hypothetical protein
MREKRIKTHRTNNTFDFLPTHDSQPEKTKRAIFLQPAGLVINLNFKNEK